MIRGGAEYGLGIYITGVDPGSAADHGGLKVFTDITIHILWKLFHPTKGNKTQCEVLTQPSSGGKCLLWSVLLIRNMAAAFYSTKDIDSMYKT